MPLSFIFHLQSCKLQCHYFSLPGEKWTFLHDLSSLSLTRKRSSCNYRVFLGFFFDCQKQGQGLDATTINKNWLSTEVLRCRRWSHQKALWVVGGWDFVPWIRAASATSRARRCFRHAHGAGRCVRSSGSFDWRAGLGTWQGLLGPAVLAGSGCCSCSSWGTASLLQLCLTLCCHWSCSAPLAWVCVLGNSRKTPCPSPLLSCSWLHGTLGNAQLPLLLRHLQPVQSCPKSWQSGLASCATGFSWEFPRTMKQTCNKYCFYRAQNHRKKSGKQTKTGSCKGQ